MATYWPETWLGKVRYAVEMCAGALAIFVLLTLPILGLQLLLAGQVVTAALPVGIVLTVLALVWGVNKYDRRQA